MQHRIVVETDLGKSTIQASLTLEQVSDCYKHKNIISIYEIECKPLPFTSKKENA